ncbi:MAG: fimbrillin family protein [Rikenella sp.]|nr:fimbrillin family protein [Rikenella sp.]
MTSDFCAIEPGSVGTNEGVFSPRNFLKVSSWMNTPGAESVENFYFYGYYPQKTAPAATYSDGGVQLEVPAAQTGEFGQAQICSSGKVSMSREEIVKEKMVRFTFAPVTSLIRLRLTLSEGTDPSITEAYIKQVILTAKNSASNLTGDCKLDFGQGKLASTESGAATHKQITVTLPSPVKITRDKPGNAYIDFVLLPTGAGTGTIEFDPRLPDNTKLTVNPQQSPEEGFRAGYRYLLDRSVTIKLDDNSDDASYVDGGNAWDNDIDHDGFYIDAGYAW